MIFLSASIPSPSRNPKYWDSADLVAIRDAVRALATVIIPKSKLIWGGHPAITPLIRYVMTNMNIDVQEHVTIYQSLEYQNIFPDDNDYFEHKIFTPSGENAEESLKIMRSQMISDNEFVAGVFIGGMDGIEIEYNMFKEMHPNAKAFPVASTGAATRLIYEEGEGIHDSRLLTDYAYMALFRHLFKDIIKL